MIFYSDITVHSGLTVGVDDTGHDVKFFGATSGSFMLWDESADALTFPDNTYIKLGTGDDLQIYHDGSNSYVKENGTGSLKLAGYNLYLEDNVGGRFLVGSKTADVALYYNDVKKFETASGGVNVTGELQADSLDIDGVADISSTLTVVGKITGESGVMFKQMSAPSNPSAGYAIMYMDSSDGIVKVKVTNSEGTTTTCSLCPAEG